MPICFVATADESGVRLYTPIDEKPKKTDDPLALARVRDITAHPAVWLLVDRWSEDWSRLAWLRLEGRGEHLAEAATAANRAHGRGRGAAR